MGNANPWWRDTLSKCLLVNFIVIWFIPCALLWSQRWISTWVNNKDIYSISTLFIQICIKLYLNLPENVIVEPFFFCCKHGHNFHWEHWDYVFGQWQQTSGQCTKSGPEAKNIWPLKFLFSCLHKNFSQINNK